MIIHKFIVHVLDKNSDVPILNDFEGKINPEVDKFFQKIIKRVKYLCTDRKYLTFFCKIFHYNCAELTVLYRKRKSCV